MYVGSTSLSLKKRLSDHRAGAKIENSKLYKRMLEIGIYNWKIVPLLTYSCDQETIKAFERQWVELLNADLNVFSPIGSTNKWVNKWNNGIGKEIKKEHYCVSLETKRYYCDVCDMAFGYNNHLKRHLKSLKHSYAYMNSVD